MKGRPRPGAGGGGGPADGVRHIREVEGRAGSVAAFRNAEWEGRFPGVVAGITSATEGDDFGMSTCSSPLRFLRSHSALATGLGFAVSVLPRQVHGGRVLAVHGRDVARRGGDSGAGPSFLVPGEADGLATGDGGVLLTVTAADCVPIYVLEPEREALGLLHAGWRGVAAGVLEAGLALLAEEWDAEPERLFVHLGPAICGDCYEVGPEVPAALGLGPPDGEAGDGKARVDLRRELAARALAAGVRAGRISRSPWCTKCAADRFHSHRGSGSTAGRMAAFLGRRTEPSG